MYGVFGLLFVAIATEVAATASLPRTHSFRDPMWTAVVVAGYALSIWLLAIIVEHLPVSVAYALWSGIGTAAVAVIGYLFLGESLTLVKAAALALIIAGVVILNLQGAHSTIRLRPHRPRRTQGRRRIVRFTPRRRRPRAAAGPGARSSAGRRR